MRSLNSFRKLRQLLGWSRNLWLRRSAGAQIASSASISLSAQFIGGKRGAIVIGEETLIAFRTLLMARRPGGEVAPIRIGRRCFIGGGAMILPGVTIADECIIGAGSVVRHDVPEKCLVAGNPARILRRGIEVGKFGRMSPTSLSRLKYILLDR